MVFSLPEASGSEQPFWGITDSLLISSIHFGLANGASNIDNSIQRMAMDNLTIGSVISVLEPATLTLLTIGIAGIGFTRKKAA